MTQYCIYKSPSDYPGQFVVRKWTIGAGTLTPSMEPHGIYDTLDEARESIPLTHRVCVQRSPEDDPVILETWL